MNQSQTATGGSARKSPPWLGVLAVVGAGLLVLPWVPWPRAADGPGEFRRGDPIHITLMACARSVENAVQRGAVQQLRDAVTADHLQWISAQLARMEIRIKPADLRSIGELHGDPGAVPFLRGAVRDNLAVMIHGRGPDSLSDTPGVLRGWRFAWDGWKWRLDLVRTLDLGAASGTLDGDADRLLAALFADNR